jgi:hypothetical protein
MMRRVTAACDQNFEISLIFPEKPLIAAPDGRPDFSAAEADVSEHVIIKPKKMFFISAISLPLFDPRQQPANECQYGPIAALAFINAGCRSIGGWTKRVHFDL